MCCLLVSVKFACQPCSFLVGTGLTEGQARVSRAAFENGGSGPAAARVESATRTRKRRMVMMVD